MTTTVSSNAAIREHYDSAYLLAAIHLGIEALGKTPSTVSIDELAPVDEFHVGGRSATDDLCQRLGLTADARVLDVGCGIGGTARFIADHYGCEVTGIDLTPTYVEIGRALTDWVGLAGQVRYKTGDATCMPFDDATFGQAVQLHVGMNIADKTALFAEVHRVLEPGGTFGLYDIMRTSDGEVAYPVPWATEASTSFVEDAPTHRSALEAAGFVVTAERDRRDFAIEFFAGMQKRAKEADGPSPLGLHLIIGNDTPTKIANLVEAIESGFLAPVEMICRK